ncbi:hypothetical protein ACF0H5_022965 [Mactra antiquata]
MTIMCVDTALNPTKKNVLGRFPLPRTDSNILTIAGKPFQTDGKCLNVEEKSTCSSKFIAVGIPSRFPITIHRKDRIKQSSIFIQRKYKEYFPYIQIQYKPKYRGVIMCLREKEMVE